MMIEIIDGVWLDPFAVTMIKSIDEKKCALWVTGQSALEGFVLDYPASEVVQVINDAIEEPDEFPEDEPGNEEDEESDEDDQDEE